MLMMCLYASQSEIDKASTRAIEKRYFLSLKEGSDLHTIIRKISFPSVPQLQSRSSSSNLKLGRHYFPMAVNAALLVLLSDSLLFWMKLLKFCLNQISEMVIPLLLEKTSLYFRTECQCARQKFLSKLKFFMNLRMLKVIIRFAPSLVLRFSVGDQIFLAPNRLWSMFPALIGAGL